MKCEIYNLLKKDLKKLHSNEKENERLDFLSDIEDIITNVDKLYQVFGDKVTDDDIKIIIANVYSNKISDFNYKKHMDYEKTEIEELESQIEFLKKYFKNEEEAEEYALKEDYSFGNISENTRIINFVSKEKNGISTAFNVCAVIFIIFGFIGSIVIGVTLYSFMTFLISLITVLFSSLMLFGFAELFQILHDIRKKIYLK